LVQIGSAAEADVRKQLESTEWQTRYEACKILKTIDTKGSAPALEKLLNDPQLLVKRTAQQALDAVKDKPWRSR
jgi:HEAT repeat protein